MSGVAGRMGALERESAASTERWRAIDDTLRRISREIVDMKTDQAERREKDVEDRRSDRRAIWGAAAVIIASMIGFTGLLLAAGGTG